MLGLLVGITGCGGVLADSAEVPAPLFKDPNYHGSCDPEIVWNSHTQEWWAFYTARRATRQQATYVGTPIGVAASEDWRTWRFEGYCDFGPHKGKPDMPVTFWAPGIARDGETYHMYVTFKDNADPPWAGKGGIVHYTTPASDLKSGWKKVGMLKLEEGPDAIDAGVCKLDDKRWLMVYRAKGIRWATSTDLTNWRCHGLVKTTNGKQLDQKFIGYQEAPYPFKWGGCFWMLTDPHDGLAVYRSNDGQTWDYQGKILKQPGTRPHDNTRARHPSVAVVGDRAFLFYHVEPWRPYPTPPAEERTVEQKRSFLQVAELEIADGKLVCDRDRKITVPRW